MALFTTLAALSQTAASNAPDGAVDAPSTIDDNLRLLASFVAQLRDANGFSATSNMIVGRAYGEYLLNADLTTQIPADDTIPQVTEGTQIISVSYTPKSATNRLRLRFQGVAAATSGPVNLIAAVFSSASANALTAIDVLSPAGGYEHMATEYEYVPGTTSALTFTVRAGPGNALTMRMNGGDGTRLLGGTQRATLVIEEIAA